MIGVLSLSGWGDIAQLVLALSGIAALVGAYAQIRTTQAGAHRARVYDYADLLNAREMLRATAKHTQQWPKWTAADFQALPDDEQLEWMRIPNIAEEIACLYNRDALDLDLAAELLGVWVERLWKASEDLVKELRGVEQRPRIFLDWERMQAATWKRRGALAPLGVRPSTHHRDPPSKVNRLRWVLSAEYRRLIRSYFPARGQRPPWTWW